MNLVDRLILPVMGHKPMTNAQIYSAVRSRAKREHYRLTPNWKATVRNTLQRHAKGRPKCGKRALFIHLDHGLWKVRH